MIKENHDLCTYRCQGCAYELEAEPIGPPVRESVCVYCGKLTTNARDMTTGELKNLHALIFWHTPMSASANSQFPQRDGRR
jgi:hypothetical protein